MQLINSIKFQNFNKRRRLINSIIFQESNKKRRLIEYKNRKPIQITNYNSIEMTGKYLGSFILIASSLNWLHYRNMIIYYEKQKQKEKQKEKDEKYN
jgi:hypothetical protein